MDEPKIPLDMIAKQKLIQILLRSMEHALKAAEASPDSMQKGRGYVIKKLLDSLLIVDKLRAGYLEPELAADAKPEPTLH